MKGERIAGAQSNMNFPKLLQCLWIVGSYINKEFDENCGKDERKQNGDWLRVYPSCTRVACGEYRG